jgi:histidine triad (HIT) family protein
MKFRRYFSTKKLALALGIVALGVVASGVMMAKSRQHHSPAKRVSQHLDDNCDFCKIIKGTAPAQIIDQDEDVIAIQKVPVRKPANFLIIPKKHIVNIKSLDPKDQFDQTIVSKIAFMAQKLSKRLKGSQDFYLRMNNGAGAAQSVFHMHAHIVSPEDWK